MGTTEGLQAGGAPPAGRLVAIHLCVDPARSPMRPVEEAAARPDHGLEGDRHARAGTGRQVLLADTAVMDAEGLAPGEIRENLAVEGLPLDGLPAGTRLRVGAAAVLRLRGPCEPCGLVDRIRPGLQERLRGRRGMLAVVEEGGRLRVGDPVTLLAAAPRPAPGQPGIGARTPRNRAP